MLETSDDDLMLAIAKGNERAFSALFRRHSSKVLGYAIKILGSQSSGEDISQDVWMKVVKQASSYQAKTSRDSGFIAWLLTMTRNACFDALRAQKKLVAFDEERGEAIADVSKDSVLESLTEHDDIVRVQGAIQRLPDSQRTALALWMTEELSYEEIAQQMNTSVSSVKSLLHRARETLSLRLKEGL